MTITVMRGAEHPAGLPVIRYQITHQGLTYAITLAEAAHQPCPRRRPSHDMVTRYDAALQQAGWPPVVQQAWKAAYMHTRRVLHGAAAPRWMDRTTGMDDHTRGLERRLQESPGVRQGEGQLGEAGTTESALLDTF